MAHAMKEFSVEDVEKHCTATDFWTIIEDKVYDLSHYLSQHPGGVLILAGAGCDSTVMFNHYHFFPQTRHRTQLAKMQIGVMVGKKSPQIGNFYQTLSSKVATELKTVAKHPLWAKVLFFVDLTMLVMLTFFGMYMMLYQQHIDNQFLLVVVPWLAHVFNNRVAGQAHAVLHMQVFGPGFVNIAQYMFQLIGTKSIFAYRLPDERAVFRTKMNSASKEARSEWLGGRGPFEHQSIHHVKGATIEHDMCQLMASQNGLHHLNPLKPFNSIHYLQRYYLGQLMVFFYQQCFSDVTRAIIAVLSLIHIGIPFRLWDEVLCSVGGVAFSVLYTMTSMILPFYGGAVTVLLSHSLRLMFCFSTLFYAQHQWDSTISEDLADTDWGRYNAETSTSLHGVNLWWHPMLWGCNGCCPSTLTYHLEHTLFPRVCYINLPKIAAICQTTCEEFNVPYHCINTYTELKLAHSDHLIRSRETVSVVADSTGDKKEL